MCGSQIADLRRGYVTITIFCLLFFFVLGFPFCSFAAPCSGPVTNSSDDTTIKGPCPNNVVIAPLNYTVQYRCDYVNSKDLSPYWHIAGLEGSPFIIGEPEKPINNILTDDVPSDSIGYTTLDIPMLQQYLNHYLIIQCGFCSLFVCASAKPLSENITSSTVELIAFSAPYSLNGVIVEKSLLLSWSPPLVSADYTDPIDFQYEVLLTKVNTSEVHQFTTNNTYLNINQFHKLTDHDICAEYWWNVSAMVEERKSVVTQSNVKVSIPSGPLPLDNSIHINITECSKKVFISFDITVVSCSDAGVLHNSIYFNDVNDDHIKSSNSSIQMLSKNIWIVESVFTLSNVDELLNGTVIVNVSNEFGFQTLNYEVVNDEVNMYYKCDEEAIPSATTIISTNTVSTTYTIELSTSSNTTPPAVESKSQEDNDVTIIISAVSAGIFLICIVGVLITLSLCVWGFRRRRGKFGLISEGFRVSSNSAETPDSSMTVSNYLSPFEAVCAKQSYEADHTSSSAMQYSEPQILKSRTLPLTQPVKPTDNQSVEVQELPGYSEVHRPNGDCITMSSEKDDPSYVPAHEIRRKKLTIKETYYAELDVPPPTCPPPPVPGTTTYSTIKETETQMIHSESPT